jgi:hypothetical protein
LTRFCGPSAHAGGLEAWLWSSARQHMLGLVGLAIKGSDKRRVIKVPEVKAGRGRIGMAATAPRSLTRWSRRKSTWSGSSIRGHANDRRAGQDLSRSCALPGDHREGERYRSPTETRVFISRAATAPSWLRSGGTICLPLVGDSTSVRRIWNGSWRHFRIF